MLRILIADDNHDMRRRLRSLLQSQDSWIVCGEAANGHETLQLVRQLLPNVVLLDLTMPDISGLEVLRRLANEGPPADVLVLSVHRTPELAREVIRAGACAVIDKSEAYEKLAPAIRALRSEPRLAGQATRRAHHIGAFFQSSGEAYRVLRSFMCDGLLEGERGIHIINPEHREAHVRELEECEIDVRRAQSHGQLELLSWGKAYLRDDCFDIEAMLELLQDLLRSGPADGFPKSRIVGHMEWALCDRPGVERIVEYESRLNYVLPQFNDVVTCVYDLSRFPAKVIDDVMRSHPAIIIGDVFHEMNPGYVPPDRMLEELRQRVQ